MKKRVKRTKLTTSATCDKTGGQQWDPLEMMVFCLSVHHIWGRTLAKHHQDACAVAYADGYIKAKLSVALLSDLKHVLKEDAGLSLNFDSTQKSKTKFLVKGISAADAHAAALRMLAANPPLITSVLCSLLRALRLMTPKPDEIGFFTSATCPRSRVRVTAEAP